MKKLVFFLVTLIFASFITMIAWAEEPIYESIKELNEEWQRNGYPDCVYQVKTSKIFENEMYTVVIAKTKNGYAVAEKIRQMIQDDSELAFKYMSINDFHEQVLLDMALITAGNPIEGLMSTGADENNVEFHIHEDHRNDAAVRKLVKELTAKYGNSVVFKFADYKNELAIDDGKGGLQTTTSYVWIIGVIALIFFFGVIVKQRHGVLLQTSTGKTVSSVDTFTIKEVENIIKETNYCVSFDVDKKVMSTIEQIETEHK